MRGSALTLLVASTLVGVCLPAEAATIRVPDDQPTIQDGVDAASHGDTVLVAAGTYLEVVNISEDILVVSESGPAATVIDAAGAEVAVTFGGEVSRDAVLHGFTVTGGTGSTWSAGGIRVAASSPTIEGNVVTDNGGPGISAGGYASPLIEGNEISANDTGIYNNNSHTTILRNSITENRGPGIRLHNSPPEAILENVVDANEDDGINGTIPDGSSRFLIQSNTVTNNADGIELTYFADRADVERNVIVGNSGHGLVCGVPYGRCPELHCNDVWDNSLGDYDGTGPGASDMSMDPLFCLEDNPDLPYSLHEGSPCLSENSPCGELVGAFGLGCGPISPVQDTSWGAIKAIHR